MALLAFLPQSARSQTDVARPPSPPGPEPVLSGALPNGLRYEIQHNPSPQTQVAIRFLIEAGSMQEPAAEAGEAHLLEHMAFRGSKRFDDGQIVRQMQRLGSRLGPDLNARTSARSTVYMLDLATSEPIALKTGFAFLHDIGTGLRLDPAALDSERRIVEAEARQRNLTPLSGLDLAEMLPGHPYARITVGQPQTIDAITPGQLRAFYQAYYRPERARLFVVGDVDPLSVEAQIKVTFGDWRGTGPPGSDPAPFSAEPGEKVFLNIGPDARMTKLRFVWTFASPQPDVMSSPRSVVLDFIVQSAFNLRLSELKGEDSPFGAGGMAVETIPGVTRQTSLIAEYISDLAGTLDLLALTRRQLMRDGVSRAEYDRIVASMKANVAQALASGEVWSSPVRAEQLLRAALQDEPVLDPQESHATLERVLGEISPADASDALRSMFSGSGPVIIYQSPASPAGGQEAFRRLLTNAESAPVPTYSPPAPVAWRHTEFGAPGRVLKRSTIADLGLTFVQFDNGVRLTIKPIKFPPGRVQVSVRFGHGRLDLPRDRVDASARSMSLLNVGGLSDLSQNQIPHVMRDHTVIAYADTDADAFEIGTGPAPIVAASDLDLEFEYLAAKLTAPGWRAASWNDLTIQADLDRNSEMSAQGVYEQASRGLQHSGDARWVSSDAATLSNLKPQDARAFIEPILRNSPLEVLVVGDVAPDAAINAVARTLGALPPRGESAEPPGSREVQFPAPNRRPLVLTHKGRPDTAIAEISWPTTDRKAAGPDAAAGDVLVDLLRQRLTGELRQAAGEAYSVNANAEFSSTFPGYGRISALAPVRPQAVAQTFRTFDFVADELARQPPTEGELAGIVGPKIEALKRAQQTIGYWFDHLPGSQKDPAKLDEIRNAANSLARVTPQDVQRVAERWLRSDRAFRISVMPAPGPAKAAAPTKDPAKTEP